VQASIATVHGSIPASTESSWSRMTRRLKTALPGE
jgi:hypothetical protein